VPREASWTTPTPFIYYSRYQFYKDAYAFRVANKIDIPNEYYSILNIPNPNPIVEAPIDPPKPPTEAQKNRALVPTWILSGMLMRETNSYYNDDGSITYVNTRRGEAGERGPFQMRRICFDTISKKGEQFWKVEKNMAFAEEMSVRYLLYLYKGQAHRNWRVAIGMYNTGPHNYSKYIKKATSYYNAIKKFGE
jgi:hypothetical protein